MTSTRKCVFNPKWLEEQRFSWVMSVENNKNCAHCKVCNTNMVLSNMGKKALESHMLSKKHITIQNLKDSNKPLFEKSNGPSISSSFSTSQNVEISRTDTDATDAVQIKSKVLSQARENLKSTGMISYLEKDNVTKAEVVWCLKSVLYHNSLRDIESSVSTMKLLFPDSKIAKSLKLSKDKASYIITYGLRNYFQSELERELYL